MAQAFPLAQFEGLQTVATAKAVAVEPDGDVLVAGDVPDRNLQPIGDGKRGVVTRFGVARFRGTGTAAGTGSISGKFFVDANENGTEDPGEAPAANMIAYTT